MNIEAWVGLSGVALVVAGGWGGIYWKLATIAAKVEVLLESSSLDREERRRMWEKLDDHAERLAKIETRVETRTRAE